MAAMITESELSLIRAGEAGDLVKVQQLLQQGASVNASDLLGESALFWSSHQGHPAVVSLLLAKGAHVDASNIIGWTPLHASSIRGHLGVVRILLDNGADTQAKTKDGESALHYASYRGHPDVVECLLTRGAELEARNNTGNRPLHSASQEGRLTTAELLLGKGADIEAETKSGFTPVVCASYGGHDDMVDFLVRQGARLDVGDNLILKRAAASVMADKTKEKAIQSLVTKPELDFKGDDTSKSWSAREKMSLVRTCNTRLITAGELMCGKTSLARAIISKTQYRAVIDDRTVVVEQRQWQDGNQTIPIVDLGGHKSYQVTGMFFLANAPNNVVLLCHDILSDRYILTYHWIKDIICHAPEAHIIPVLTRTDKLPPEKSLEDSIRAFVVAITKLLQHDIKSLELKSHLTKREATKNKFEGILKCYQNLNNQFEKKIITVSTAPLKGKTIEYLKETITEYSSLPENQMEMPEIYQQFYERIGCIGSKAEEKQGKLLSTDIPVASFAKKQKITSFQSMEIKSEKDEKNPAVSTPAASTHPSMLSKHSAEMSAQSLPSTSSKRVVEGSADQASSDLPYLSFADAKAIFEEIERELNPGRPLQYDVRKCLTTLHNLGLIMAFSGTNKLEQFVFNNHSTVIAILKAIFHHNTDNFLEYKCLEAKDQALFKGKKATFQLHRNMLNTQGIMSKPILQTLLHHNSCEIDEDFVTDLIVTLKVGYKFVEAENKDEHIFIPYYIEDSIISPDIIAKIQPTQLFEDGNVALNVKIVGNITQTYFNRTVLHIYQLLPSSTSHTVMKVWGQGLYYRFGSKKILVHYDGREEIKLQIAGQPKTLPKMWEHIKEIHNGMEGLRHEWTPGMIDEYTLTCVCENMSTSSTHEPCTLNLEDVLSNPAPDACYCKTTGQKIPAALVTPLVEGSSECEEMVKEVENFIKEQMVQKKDEWEVLALQTMHPDPVIDELFSKCVLSSEEKMDLENLGIFAKTELLLKTIKKKARQSDLIEALKVTGYPTNVGLHLFMTGQCDKSHFLTEDDTDSIKRDFSQAFLDYVNPVELKVRLIEKGILDVPFQREDFEIRQSARKKADYLLNYILLRGTVQTVQGFHRAIIASNQPDIASCLEKAVPHIFKSDNV